MNAVVRILAHGTRFDWEYPFNTQSQSVSGSGFYVDAHHIVTCAHVVEQAHTILLVMDNQRYPATILGLCPMYDVALLHCDHANVFLALDEREVTIGMATTALGYPLGENHLKHTQGIISGQQNNLYQVDTPLNPGNSGGPLLYHGRVIGINSSSRTDAQNVNFAVPIARFTLIEAQLRARKANPLVRVPEFWGFEYQYTSASLQQQTGAVGVYVIRSSRPEIHVGDVVTRIGSPIDAYGTLDTTWMNERMTLSNLISRMTEGTRVAIHLTRQHKKMTVSVVLDSTPLPIRTMYPAFEDMAYRVVAGLIVMPLSLDLVELLKSQNPRLAVYAELKHRRHQRLVVVNVLRGGLVDKQRLPIHAGDVLASINGVAARDLRQLEGDLTLVTERETVVVLSADELRQEDTWVRDTYAIGSSLQK